MKYKIVAKCSLSNESHIVCTNFNDRGIANMVRDLLEAKVSAPGYDYSYTVEEEEKVSMYVKPPLGLIDKKIWDLKVSQEMENIPVWDILRFNAFKRDKFIERLHDIQQAIDRYKEVDKEVPREWMDEYFDLIRGLK